MMLPQIDESFCVQKRMRGNFDYAVRRWRTDGSWHLDCNVIREPNQRSKVFRVIWFVQERSGPRCSTCLGYMLTKCGNEFYMCSLLISMFVGMIFFRWPSVLHVTFTEGARTAGRGRVARSSDLHQQEFFLFLYIERENILWNFGDFMFWYYQNIGSMKVISHTSSFPRNASCVLGV